MATVGVKGLNYWVSFAGAERAIKLGQSSAETCKLYQKSSLIGLIPVGLVYLYAKYRHDVSVYLRLNDHRCQIAAYNNTECLATSQAAQWERKEEYQGGE